MSKLHYILAACAICLALSGCDSNKNGAEAAVLEDLKDPDSARFGEFYFNDETKKGCLTVNAKNSMGGYTGDEQAFIVKEDNKWRSFFADVADPAFCREYHADKKD